MLISICKDPPFQTVAKLIQDTDFKKNKIQDSCTAIWERYVNLCYSKVHKKSTYPSSKSISPNNHLFELVDIVDVYPLPTLHCQCQATSFIPDP